MTKEENVQKKFVVIGAELDTKYTYRYTKFGIVKDGQLKIMELSKDTLEQYKRKTVVRQEYIEVLNELLSTAILVRFFDYIINYKNEYDVICTYFKYGWGLVIELGAIPEGFNELVVIVKKSEINRLWPVLIRIEEDLEQQKEDE